MALNETNVVTSHNTLNYTGLLFNKGNTRNPFLSMIAGRTRQARAWEFATSIDYTTGGGAQPSITESASLTAPNPEKVGRTQNTNYCQIFQRAISVSYAKTSSMAQLSGVNIAGGAPNPADEVDFQIANALQAMRNDMEYTFISGAGQNGTYDDVAYKTKGLLEAITTNTVAAGGAALNYWHIAEAIQKINAAHAPTNNLVLLAKGVQIMQINANAISNKMTVIPASREVNGIKLDQIITPFGYISLLPIEYIKTTTTGSGASEATTNNAIIANIEYIAPALLDVPGKGNFFVEELAKTGASERYQLYGQAGLDYGAEWYHAKITGLTTSFSAPA